MNARTAVITGAAGGLGQPMVRQLSEAGFDVVAVTRGAADGALHADLFDRNEIRALAARLRDTVGSVDVLIHNAGAAFAHYRETADGVERAYAVNHLAPFLLTHLLLADGVLAADARVIGISSGLVTRGRIAAEAPDVTGVSWRDRYAQLTVYGTAKLTGLLATTALAARLPAGMSACSVDPGVLRTGFSAKSGGLLRAVSAVSNVFATPPEKAARTPVLLASAAAPDGDFFVKGVAEPVPHAALAADVYERTARALDLTPLASRTGRQAR